MSNDMPEAKWNQVSSQVQIFWSRIDDEDLKRIAGKADRLADALHHRYGYTKQHAESQSIRWMRKHRDEYPVGERTPSPG
jgi:uncharacterized protein YjbJ (UPF0337 family)